MDQKLAQKLEPWVPKLDPSIFNHIPTDTFDYGPYMYAKDTAKQGGSRPSFSFSVFDKKPSRDHSPWHHFPKLDMHIFDGSNPFGWISLMEQYF